MALLYRLLGPIRSLVVLGLALLVLSGVGLALTWLSDWRWAVGLLVGVVLLLLLAGRARRWVPRRTVLEVDFERGVVEKAPEAGLPQMGGPKPLALQDVLDALGRAAADRRVVGLVARMGSFAPGLAVAQELRDAVQAFRERGKHAVAWAETLGEGRSATVETMLASAFDEVFVQPSGDVNLDGVLMDHPFLRGTLDKVGIEPQMDHRREYKAAKYLFTEHRMNEAHRESASSLMDSQVEQIVAGISADRGIDTAQVRALLDRGPFRAREAKEAGLLDGVAYRDEVYGALKEKLRGRFLHLERYLRRAGRPHKKGVTIAVVCGVGQIARGKGKPRRRGSGGTFGSDDVAAAIRKAAKAKRVKAIVLRVDSPGGSAVASDTVWREVKRAREQGTPVIASMGNLAASGGYYVSCGADRIVAQPGTITGSIGVVWGKFFVREAWKKVGVEWDSLQVGTHADLWSGNHPFDEAGWARVEELLDAVYDDFKERVAEGRGLTPDQVEAVAKGRVWTGLQAKANGLVDDLGGLERAIELAKEAAGIAAGAPVKVRRLPRPRRLAPWRQEESSEAAARALALAVATTPLGPLLALADDLGLGREPGRLEMPPLPLSTRAREI